MTKTPTPPTPRYEPGQSAHIHIHGEEQFVRLVEFKPVGPRPYWRVRIVGTNSIFHVPEKALRISEEQ